MLPVRIIARHFFNPSPYTRFAVLMKDYYSILECTPRSTRDEIRRNYRRLAQQFHPDKNADDPYSNARFQDIKEAYDTLTQPVRKEAWLQERWLKQVMNNGQGETAPLTPYFILDKVLKFEQYISTLDEFRMDKFGLSQSMEDLLSNERMECLQRFNETDINRTIISHLLAAAKPLPLTLSGRLIEKLEILADNDPDCRKNISRFRKNLEQTRQQERYTLPLIILATLLICGLIYFMGKGS